MQQGLLDVKELEELSAAGEIDTVLCMFTDLQGRFMGKRVVPHFFLEEVLGEEGLHACLYLLAIDMEMEPLPGYEYASWETGYGDFRMVPDVSTLRWCPWLEKTAMVICDIADEDTGEPVEVAPRQILKRQIARAAEKGFVIKTGSELEFYLFRDGYDDIADGGYRNLRPSSTYIMDYHMLQTTKDEWIIRQIRNGMLGAGIPIEFSKGEFGKGQHEINITYADALTHGRLPLDLQARREGDLSRERCRRHVHGEVDDGRGRLVVPHALERVEQDREEVADVRREGRAPPVGDVPPLHGRAHGDRAGDVVHVRAVRELVQAVPTGLVGADRDRVEPRQPHVRVPHRGRAHGRTGGVTASRAAT